MITSFKKWLESSTPFDSDPNGVTSTQSSPFASTTSTQQSNPFSFNPIQQSNPFSFNPIQQSDPSKKLKQANIYNKYSKIPGPYITPDVGYREFKWDQRTRPFDYLNNGQIFYGANNQAHH